MPVAKFMDRSGNEWVLELTVGDLTRARVHAEVNFGTVLTNMAELDGLLYGDLEKFGRLIWTLVEKQAEKIGLTPEQFADGFDKSTIDAARLAVMDAIADFTQPLETAAEKKAAIRGLMKAADRAMAAKIKAAASEMWNGTAGNSLASPESTPAPAPSAN